MTTKMPSSDDIRYEALELAVRHHGYANQAQKAIPPNPVTVLQTAEMFANYLRDGIVPPATQRHGNSH